MILEKIIDIRKIKILEKINLKNSIDWILKEKLQ